MTAGPVNCVTGSDCQRNRSSSKWRTRTRHRLGIIACQGQCDHRNHEYRYEIAVDPDQRLSANRDAESRCADLV